MAGPGRSADVICDRCKRDQPKLRYAPRLGWTCVDCAAATDKAHGPVNGITVFVRGAPPRPGYDAPVVKRSLY